MDWSGNDWLGNTVYVESYFQSQPNELSVNAIALEPMQPFQSCHELGEDVKSKPTASPAQVILRGEQDIARYAVYDARGQLLVRDLDELAYKEWCSKDSVASGLYIVLIEASNKIQVEKLLIP
jgi:hypothetical protein